MQDILKSVEGNKTYIGLAFGALIIIANHFGVPIPGITSDPNQWLNDLWTLAMVAAGRSALKKAGTGT